jgi:hypothetical protein
MRKRWLLALVVAGLAGTARAADHADGAAVKLDPTTDITDVYAWLPDATHVALVMDVFPGATTTSKFSDSALYVFHINAGQAYGDTAPKPAQVVCQFTGGDPAKAQCWAGPLTSPTGVEYVTGDATTAAGLSSTSGKLTVFAGLRDDPFFFNIHGFKAAIAAFGQANAGGGIMFDTAGCPMLTPQFAGQAAQILASDGAGNPGKDDFAKGGNFASGNVLSIVVQVDVGLISPGGGKTLGIWGSTNKVKTQ